MIELIKQLMQKEQRPQCPKDNQGKKNPTHNTYLTPKHPPARVIHLPTSSKSKTHNTQHTTTNHNVPFLPSPHNLFPSSPFFLLLLLLLYLRRIPRLEQPDPAMSSIASLGTAAHLPPGGLVVIAWCGVGVAGGFGEFGAPFFFLFWCGGMGTLVGLVVVLLRLAGDGLVGGRRRRGRKK